MEAIGGAAARASARPRKYTVAMILSSASAALAPGWRAGCWPRWRGAYVLAALPRPRLQRAVGRRAGRSAWCCTRLLLVLDIGGLGQREPRRAPRLRAGAVADGVAGARRAHGRKPPRAAARRAPRAGAGWARWRWCWPGAVPGRAAAADRFAAGRRCTGCWVSAPTACSARRCCMPRCWTRPSAACAPARRRAAPRAVGHAAAAAGAADLPLRRGRLRRAHGRAGAGRADHAQHVALGPQDGVLAARLGGVRGAAGRAPAARLARPARHALALCRRGAAAAGLCRLALRARSAARARRRLRPTGTDHEVPRAAGAWSCWRWVAVLRSGRRKPPPVRRRRRPRPAPQPQAHACWPAPLRPAPAARPRPLFDAAGRPYLQRGASPGRAALKRPPRRRWPHEHGRGTPQRDRRRAERAVAAAQPTAARATAAPASAAGRRPPQDDSLFGAFADSDSQGAAESCFDPGWLAAGDRPLDSRFVLAPGARVVGAGAGQRAGARLPHLRRGACGHRRRRWWPRRAWAACSARAAPNGWRWSAVVYAVQAITLWLLPRFGALAQPQPQARQRRRQWLATIGVDLLAFTLLHLLAVGSTFNFAALLVLPVLMAGVLTLAPAGAGHGRGRGADAAAGGLAHGARRRRRAAADAAVGPGRHWACSSSRCWPANWPAAWRARSWPRAAAWNWRASRRS